MQLKPFLRILFVYMLIGWLMSACGQESSQTNTNSDTTKSEKAEEVSTQKEIEATYLDCTVYAGSTIFFFQSVQQGDTIQVSILNKGMEEAENSAKVPENLVDDSEDIEGVPGANPKMVGKKFKIIYNEKDEVREVKAF